MRGLAAVIVLAALLGGCGGDDKDTPAATEPTGMTVTSAAFADGKPIPKKYSCDGAEVSPPLAWEGAPSGTVELALVVVDPDAPGGDFVHWTVTGIDPETTSVDEGDVPDGGVEHETSKGKPGYVGMCPPSGTHHYRFMVLALTTKLDLPSDLDAKKVVQLAETTATAGGVLVGTYKR